ncbi:MAG TPA: diphthine synthase [Methanomicrobiales archaeon]|jgi:diphthine synthase|nr:diphthine synthase [Methanomicrobiales archaeon]
MLTFIGLGLSDERDISVKGLEAARAADAVYLETHTSRLTGTTREAMEKFYGRPVVPLTREDLEVHPEEILGRAKAGDVALLCGGDPMVSTTHADLRLRAKAAGVVTRIIHGASIGSAVCGETGLQNYRFGKSTSLPFPAGNWFPTTPLETILGNLALRLHTLVFLDIREDRLMTMPEGIALLGGMAARISRPSPSFLIGIARAGSPNAFVAAGSPGWLAGLDFGPPLHVLVVPADLHPVEQEYLEAFALYEGRRLR